MRTTPARRVASTAAAIFVSLMFLGMFLIPLRYLGATVGIVPTARVTAEASAPAPTPSATGKTITAEYCSEAVTASNPSNLAGRTSTNLVFNDSWLLQDADSYHHDLATACAVLAAVCNSESQYYSNVEGAAPYAEQSLWALGFADVRTESYALRSNILDELGALFIGSHDVAAYTFASKTIPDPQGGTPLTLVFVGVRGSYGIEWISNFNLHDAQGDSDDHHGFGKAETEVERALARYAHEIGASPERTRILITGHSRGGAIANLLAARLNNLGETSNKIAPASGIYAYTFAAPGCTRESDRQSPAYDNIFNIVNESDIVPKLPLSTWGYGRYGTTVALPSVSSDQFSTLFDRMREAFQRNTGIMPTYDKAGLASIDTFENNMDEVLTSIGSPVNPARIVAAAGSLLGVDFGAALASHFPDTYIAWMQSTDDNSLSFDAPAKRTAIAS
ncbi:MAG: hypothetical protein PEGG_01672 [Paraeggerthella hongkongensis]